MLFDCRHVVKCVAFAPDGSFFVAGCEDSNIIVVQKGKMRFLKNHHARSICGISVTPDSSFVISVAEDMIHVTDSQHNDVFFMFNFFTITYYLYVNAHAFAGNDIWIGASNGCIYKFSVDTGVKKITLKGNLKYCQSAISRVSATSQHVACSELINYRVFVWNVNDRRQVCKLEHSAIITDIQLAQDHVFTAGVDGIVRQFSLSGELVQQFSCHEMRGRKAARKVLHANRLVGTFSGSAVYIWDAHSMNLRSTTTTKYEINAAAFNEKQLVTVGENFIHVQTLIPWNDRDHGLFGRKFIKTVFRLMCIKARLETGAHQNRQKKSRFVIPRLPLAVWLSIFSFLDVYN